MSYKGFIKRFGKWKVAEACEVKDLPFIKDIEKYLDESESLAIAATIDALVAVKEAVRILVAEFDGHNPDDILEFTWMDFAPLENALHALEEKENER